MAKWLTSLALLMVMGASVLAGTPLHTGEHECDMPGMKDGMDCCAKARSQGNAPEVTAARLCCAVNCQSPATTPAGSVLRVSSPAIVARHPAAIQIPSVVPVSPLRFDSASEHPQHSPPAYIQHLALLI
jgi:hypothetical protein